MMMSIARFNTYLCAVLLLSLAGGCQTEQEAKEKKEKKEVSLIRFHLETFPDGTTENAPVPILRANPMQVNVHNNPFLEGEDVSEASVVEEPGGLFSIRLKFTQRGSMLLEATTSANPGKRIAIRCLFGQDRWLAAPLIRRRIGDGIMVFTPDTTREEAERIVRGLNNAAAAYRKAEKW